MFNQHYGSKRLGIKRMEAFNILPQIRDIVLALSEENVKEVNRILTAFSEIGELPKTLSSAKLDYALLRDDTQVFEAFQSLYWIAVFLTDSSTVEVIRSRLITRYPFDMKNTLFIRLSLAAKVPENYLALLCFYFERDYDNEFGKDRKTPFSAYPAHHG